VPVSAAGDEDRITVPDAARELAFLRSELGPIDGIRRERVEAMRAAVAGGRCQADTSRTASGLLRDVLAQLLA
jgi:anti-sigma28 factor (negative regulator of flagellin synthesis)